MPDYMELIAAVIAIFMIISVVIFVLSIIRKWGKIYKIYWGTVVFISLHMFLFAVALFIYPPVLPSILSSYALGVLSLLDKLFLF